MTSRCPPLWPHLALALSLAFPALAPASASVGDLASCQPDELTVHYRNELIDVGVWAGERPLPECLQAELPLAVFVRASARLSGVADGRKILERFGQISRFANLPYWSTTRHRWRPMILASVALDDSGRERADFTPAELASGRVMRFRQVDNTLGTITYRMTVDASRQDRIAVAIENETPARRFLLTVFEANALAYVHRFHRMANGEWAYEGAIQVTRGLSLIIGGHDDSFANRADAIFRGIALLGPDAARPLAP